MVDQQCAVKLTAEDVNKSITWSKGHKAYLWRQRPVERIWVQGFVRQLEGSKFVLSDAPEGSTPHDSSCQIDVVMPQLRPNEADPGPCSRLVNGDYVLVVGKFRVLKGLNKSSSSSGSLSTEQQARRMGINSHKVIKLPGEGLSWQQIWLQEIAHLHSVVYPQTLWRLSQ